MSNAHHDHGDEFDVHPHVSSTKGNAVILGILFALTFLTVAAYRIRLGDANLTVALLIATVKAALVCTFFMHLKYEKAFNTLFFVGTLAFVGVFFFFTHNDTGYRGEIDGRTGKHYDYRAQAFAAGTADQIVQQHGEMRPIPPAAEGAAAEGHGAAEGAPAGGH